MGNTSSDALDHSFKRLRISRTEQLSQLSPSCISPKRKMPATNIIGLPDTFNNEIQNDPNDQLPTLLCGDNISFPSGNSVVQNSKSINHQLPDGNSLSDEELMCMMESCATSVFFNDKRIHRNIMLWDTEISMYSNMDTIPELSDDELIQYVKRAYIHRHYK